MEANFRLRSGSGQPRPGWFSLIMAFEEEFGGEISDEEAQRIASVGDAVRFLDSEKRM